MFTQNELMILKKFEKGSIIETPQEERILRRYAAIALVRLGHEADAQGNVRKTAKLSSLGKRFLWRAGLNENDSTSPIKKFFYSLFNSVY